MRRWAFIFSLLACLTGTPLRQAEAASDLSQSLAELFQSATLESPDGGVGDDSGVGTLTTSERDSVADTSSAADLTLLCLPPVTVPPPPDGDGLRERVWWPQAPPGVRH